jgi:uncharacterized protein YkwD
MMHGFAARLLASVFGLMLLALAGCQSGGAPDASGGASRSGLAYLSEFREANGLPSLKPDPRLERAALRQAGYMASAGRMAHDTGWRKDFATRMDKGGIDAPAAENLAHGRMDMAKLFSMWKNSAGHRRNMLDPRFGRFGLAYAGRGGERYWALVLSK